MAEWILTSSVLILIVIALRGILKGKISLRLQYGLWALVLVRLLIPISITNSAISVGNLVENIRQQSAVQEISTSLRQYESIYADILDQYERMGITVTPAQIRQEARDQIYSDTYAEVAAGHSGENSSDSVLRMEAQRRVEAISYAAMVTAALPTIWYVGMIAVALVLIGSNLHFGRKLRRSRQALDLPGVPLKTYRSAYAATPCLFGFPMPAIYLTEEVLADSGMRSHVLAHELSHYRQLDHIWSLLRSVCLILHWYNPLVWAAAILSKRDAELACDEATIRALSEAERMAYGRTLISMTCVQRNPRNLLLTATTMQGSKKALNERVSLIAKGPRTAQYTLIVCVLVSAIAVGCTFTGAQAADPTDDPFVPEPTGYPIGNLQRVLIFANGHPYLQLSQAPGTEIPEAYESIGTILAEDGCRIPDQELTACHVSVGTEVYADPADNRYICYLQTDAEDSLVRWLIRLDLADTLIRDITGMPDSFEQYREIWSKTNAALESFDRSSLHFTYTETSGGRTESYELWSNGSTYVQRANGSAALEYGGYRYSFGNGTWSEGSSDDALGFPALAFANENRILYWYENGTEIRVVIDTPSDDMIQNSIHESTYIFDTGWNLKGCEIRSRHYNDDGTAREIVTTYQFHDTPEAAIEQIIHEAYLEATGALAGNPTLPATEPTEPA